MKPFCAALIAVLLHAAAGAQPPAGADALANALQQRYQGVRDFSADFVHTYRGGALRKQLTERGTMAIKKPGMMRWNYNSPEKKAFVSDGTKLYSYMPDDRQVIVSDVPPDNSATTPAMFLAGKGNIVRDFTATFGDAHGPKSPSLKLTPRRQEAEYDQLLLVLDPATLRIVTLTTTDAQGGQSTLTFSNVKENQGLSDKEFAFRIPRGVEVLTDRAAAR